MSNAFRSDELLLCQIPAIELLVNLGYHYLTPDQLLQARGSQPDNVLLEEVVQQQLKHLNAAVPEVIISSALMKLKDSPVIGLQVSNAQLYNLLILGLDLTQTQNGNTQYFYLRYIDWEHQENNVFHVAANYTLAGRRSMAPITIDLMLFVNGIPFVVIECVAPQVSVQQAQANLLKCQNSNNLLNLFIFPHIMLALNGKEASYAPIGSRAPHWACWREAIPYEELCVVRTQALPVAVKAALFDLVQMRMDAPISTSQERPPYHNHYEMNQQDQTLYALCRPARLLELVRNATVFDGNVRKLVRYHQFFAVQRAMQQVRQWKDKGQRQGGVIVQAEGSGKSLTMICLARKLALASDIPEPRILVVSKRDEFGDEFGDAFGGQHGGQHGGHQLSSFFSGGPIRPTWAKTGHDILFLLASGKAQLILSIPHPFSRASGTKKFRDDSPDIFLLIEEDHQQPLGSYAASIQKMFPNACYIGFSGTPLMINEKIFPLIDEYSVRQAQQDGLLVPLFYEARNPRLGDSAVQASGLLNEQTYEEIHEQTYEQANGQFNTWFERQIAHYGPDEKQKYRQTYQESRSLPDAQRCLYDIAIDVSNHIFNGYQGSGLKGQLVAPDELSALHFKAILDRLGNLDTALVFAREAKSNAKKGKSKKMLNPPPGEEAHQLLQRLWHQMIESYDSEDAYQRQIMQQFISNDKPTLVIVVDQLLDSFDAPPNAVLYLTRNLSGHTLLQAVARVNRASDAKPFGRIIDYTGTLGQLDQPLSSYPALAGFNEADLEASLFSPNVLITQLPSYHAGCWSLFQLTTHDNDDDDNNKQDRLERELSHPALRAEFHLRLTRYCQSLNLALDNAQFLQQCTDNIRTNYQQDALRLLKLKIAVQLRYAEKTGMGTDETMLWQRLHRTRFVNPNPNLLEPIQFQKILHDYGLHGPVAQADAIAFHLQRHLIELQDEDSHGSSHGGSHGGSQISGQFQRELQKQLHQVMNDFQARRIDEAHYLAQIRVLYASFLQPSNDPSPDQVLNTDGLTLRLVNLILPILHDHAEAAQKNQWANAGAQAFMHCLQQTRPTAYYDASDQLKQIANQIDDYLCDVMEKEQQAALSNAQKDDLISQVLLLAQECQSAR